MLTKNQQNIIFIFPIIISILLVLLMLIPFTRNFAFWLLEENKPIEVLTFLFFIIGGVFGMYFSKTLFKNKEKVGVSKKVVGSFSVDFFTKKDFSCGGNRGGTLTISDSTKTILLGTRIGQMSF